MKKKFLLFNLLKQLFFVSENQFICDCRLSWMYKLRNETKNERVRNSLDELTCYLENSDIKILPAATTTKVTTMASKTIRQPFTPNDYDDEENPLGDDEEYLYDQQENNSNTLAVTKQEDPFMKHLFQIAVNDLPCPQSLHAPTETTNRIEGTPPPDFPFMLSSNSRSRTNDGCTTSPILSFSALIFIALLFT